MIKRIKTGAKYFVMGDLMTVIAVKKEEQLYGHVVVRLEDGTRDYIETRFFRKVAEKHRPV